MEIEAVMAALADPTRLRIVRLLSHLELAVGELAQVLGQSQPRVSRHVGILCASALAERRREGSWTFLRRTISEDSKSALGSAVARLLAAAEAEDTAFAAQCEEDRRHLLALRSSRENAAEEYFARMAGEWDDIRTLLSPPAKIESALVKALGNESVGRVLDVGTGTGRIAELVAPRAEHIVGLDRSPEMLRLARARLQKLPLDQWELVQADFGSLPFGPGTFDTVIFHQVLHYAQEPAFPLREAARVCSPGGRIAIVDLAAHEREEMRTRHAHVRLGFSDLQMEELLRQSGFEPLSPVALPGQVLTTKIWLAAKTQVR